MRSNDYDPNEFSGGGASLFQAVDDSDTSFGLSIGAQVSSSAFEKAEPFASLERYQVGGGGFQVLRLGSRWTIDQ